MELNITPKNLDNSKNKINKEKFSFKDFKPDFKRLYRSRVNSLNSCFDLDNSNQTFTTI